MLVTGILLFIVSWAGSGKRRQSLTPLSLVAVNAYKKHSRTVSGQVQLWTPLAPPGGCQLMTAFTKCL